MALLLCERQQNWLRVVTVVFRTMSILLRFFTFFTFFCRASYVFSNYDSKLNSTSSKAYKVFLQSLRRVQNTVSRIVCRPTKLATCARQNWLQDCRPLLKSRQTTTTFVSDLLLSPYRQSRVLRSSTSDLLSTESSSTNIAARWFSCGALTVWNSLPSFVRTADSFTSFRSQFNQDVWCLQDISYSVHCPRLWCSFLSRVINSLLTYLLTDVSN